MTRITHTQLPLGLNSLAIHESNGITLRVAAGLDHDVQRAAIRTAVRAARHAGWITPYQQGSLMLLVLVGSARFLLARLVPHAALGKAAAGTAAAALAAAAVATTVTHPNYGQVNGAPPAAAAPAPLRSAHVPDSRRKDSPTPQPHARPAPQLVHDSGTGQTVQQQVMSPAVVQPAAPAVAQPVSQPSSPPAAQPSAPAVGVTVAPASPASPASPAVPVVSASAGVTVAPPSATVSAKVCLPPLVIINGLCVKLHILGGLPPLAPPAAPERPALQPRALAITWYL